MVLDASVALAWFLPGEDTPASNVLRDTLAIEGAIVPAIWFLEIANTLWVALRRRRITEQQRRIALADLSAYPIACAGEMTFEAWPTLIDLADRYAIAVYDACYLDLARSLRQPLATLDAAMTRAAAAEGIRLVL